MSEPKKRPSITKYILASIAALLVIGVAATTIMIKAKKREQPVILPTHDSSDSPDENEGSKNDSADESSNNENNDSIKAAKSDKASVTFPIDINIADIATFCQIEGIGEYTAKNIIAYRESVGIFTSLEQLLNVEGIGKKTFERIKKYLYVSDSDKAKAANATLTTKTPLKKTTSKTTAAKTTKTTHSEAVLKDVNINTSTAEEISKCLLIKTEAAQKIVETREKLHGFKTKEEILLSNAISENYYLEIQDHIII